MEYRRFENLERAYCRELEKLDRKYAGDAEMSEQDAERGRTMYHALKCAVAIDAMVEASHNGMSGTRYHGPRMDQPMYSEYNDPYFDRRRW